MPAAQENLAIAEPRKLEAGSGFYNRRELVRQAQICGSLGSLFVRQVLEAASCQLDVAPRLAARIDGWPGDFAADAVAMRLNAGLHALARRNVDSDLARLYLQGRGDFDRVLATALAAGEAELLEWLEWPTQTNEVARSCAFMAALMTISMRDPCEVELLELGASAGLNLNLARYRHVLGGRVAGDHASQLTIAPAWHGPPPPQGKVQVLAARGVDLRPVDIANAAARERMMAFIWADQPQRADRLAAALEIARNHPPAIERGSAQDWLPVQLSRPQVAGTRRVVVHSMVAQYMPPREWRGLVDMIVQAGARATPERPFAWISLEWTRDRREVQLRLAEWTGEGGDGRMTTLAVCHPYGARIHWLGREGGCGR